MRANLSILADGRKVLVKKYGDTSDIARAVYNGYVRSYKQTSLLARQLKGYNIYVTCGNIFNYLLRNVKYLEDPRGVQWIKTPARLLKDRTGDCKSMSIFIASCLRNLNIPHYFRFVSFSRFSADPTHVYVVAVIDGKELFLDAVTKKFNYQVPFVTKYDTKIIGQISLKQVAGLNYIKTIG